ncbi:MAG: RelA/SpoT family protein [Treponemataceae bacterium]
MDDEKEKLIHDFLKDKNYTPEEKQRITDAWHFLCERTGEKTFGEIEPEPLYLHYLRVATILAENGMNGTGIVAGLLHDIYRHGVNEADVKNKFGEAVAKIVDGTSKIMQMPIHTKTLQQSAAIRKMFFALADDIRVIIIKLADQLDRIHHIKKFTPDEQKALASEVLEIWAPLAERLGMSKEKNEFEDLNLKYTNPEAFQQIKKLVNQKQSERKAYLETAMQKIMEAAEKNGFKVSISSRAKHFYSIYQKIRKRNVPADQIFDLFALRIICDTEQDCYTLIGVVHSLWKPLDGKFKDYIAMPKSNGYQSLHTTVMCEGHPLEIQIRTQKMHDIAEHGIASHWLYKKGSTHDLVSESGLSIFNQLREVSSKDFNNDEAFFRDFKNELLSDTVLVFTPAGDVKELPIGSTAVDFAYSIHSDIGQKIVGAKANGKIIPLNRPLQNTEIIEVLTHPMAHPQEGQLEYVKTAKARQKINAYIASHLTDMPEKPVRTDKPRPAAHGKKTTAGNTIELDRRKVVIANEKNFLVRFAQCCNPQYNEPISGYVSRGRGVIIHRADCTIFQQIPDIEHRTIDVHWAEPKEPAK